MEEVRPASLSFAWEIASAVVEKRERVRSGAKDSSVNSFEVWERLVRIVGWREEVVGLYDSVEGYTGLAPCVGQPQFWVW